jgi:hypothetical protein
MATPLIERTVLPPEDLGRLGGVLAALTTRRAPGAALIGPDGERLELPPEVFEILREVVEALAGGLAITIAPHQSSWSRRRWSQPARQAAAGRARPATRRCGSKGLLAAQG